MPTELRVQLGFALASIDGGKKIAKCWFGVRSFEVAEIHRPVDPVEP